MPGWPSTSGDRLSTLTDAVSITGNRPDGRPLSELGCLEVDELLRLALALTARVAEEHVLDRCFGNLHPDRIAWNSETVTLRPAPMALPDDPQVASARYLAPEQATDPKVEPGLRTDVFQLGVILYEAATGVHPFADDSVQRVLDNIVSYSPPPPGNLRRELLLEWDGILACCMHKDPRQRYASALDVEAQLEELARQGGTRRKQLRPRWRRILLAAVILAAAAWLLGWLL